MAGPRGGSVPMLVASVTGDIYALPLLHRRVPLVSGVGCAVLVLWVRRLRTQIKPRPIRQRDRLKRSELDAVAAGRLDHAAVVCGRGRRKREDQQAQDEDECELAHNHSPVARLPVKSARGAPGKPRSGGAALDLYAPDADYAHEAYDVAQYESAAYPDAPILPASPGGG